MTNGNNPVTGAGRGGNLKSERNPFTHQRKDANYPEFEPTTTLSSAVNTLLKAGCAFLVGTTRDGGALCITILDKQERHRTYCSTPTELEEALQAIMQTFA